MKKIGSRIREGSDEDEYGAARTLTTSAAPRMPLIPSEEILHGVAMMNRRTSALCSRSWLSLCLALGCLSSCLSAACVAQSTSVAQMQQHKADWDKYAAEERKFQIHGRFHGRTADTFTLEQLDIPCRLSSSVKLPDRMRDGQRMELSGRMVSENGKRLFQVSRMLVRETDVEQINRRARALPEADPATRFALADEFVPDAEFYRDMQLSDAIHSLRTQGIALKRKLAKSDPQLLREVHAEGLRLTVDARLLRLLQFEVLHTEWKNPGADLEALLIEIKQTCEGWNRQIPEVPERLIAPFQKDASAVYENGSDDDRLWLHRLMFLKIRLQQIESILKPDGSNGLSLAAIVRSEFPAEQSAASTLEEQEVKFRLGRVDQLTRQEFQELAELLTRLSRSDKIRDVLQEWLSAQERRFGRDTIAGLLRTADEFLFAAENWKDVRHHEQAVELLKQAWFLASVESPDDARQISERLKRYGWERLNNQWLTPQQVLALPKNDIQLAVREGRVVRGMTVEQVVQTLGQPARISRLGSSRVMRELWVYDAEGDAGLVVRFRRSLADNRELKTVEDVSKINATR